MRNPYFKQRLTRLAVSTGLVGFICNYAISPQLFAAMPLYVRIPVVLFFVGLLSEVPGVVGRLRDSWVAREIRLNRERRRQGGAS